MLFHINCYIKKIKKIKKALGVGRALVGVACTMAVILELEKRGKLPFKAIF